MAKEETIEISVANTESITRVPLSEAREWEPKKMTNILEFMHFHNGENFVSMSIKNFNELYAEKLKAAKLKKIAEAQAKRK